MAVSYLGAMTPMTFAQQSVKSVINGSLALGSLFKGINNNQAWLATQDVPAGNFFTNPTARRAHVDGGDTWPASPTTQEGDKIVFNFRIPAYAQYVELWFWCVRDYSISSTNSPTIFVESIETGETRKCSLLAGGSQQTGKLPVTPVAVEAQWVRFVGIISDVVDPSETDTALKVRGDLTSDWRDVKVRAWSSDNSIRIYTGAYRVIPYKGRMPHWDGTGTDMPAESEFIFESPGEPGDYIAVDDFVPEFFFPGGGEASIPAYASMSIWVQPESTATGTVFEIGIEADVDHSYQPVFSIRYVPGYLEVALFDPEGVAVYEQITTSPDGGWHNIWVNLHPSIDSLHPGIELFYDGEPATDGGTTHPSTDWNFSRLPSLASFLASTGGLTGNIPGKISTPTIFGGISPGSKVAGLVSAGPFHNVRNSIGTWTAKTPRFSWVRDAVGGRVANSGNGGAAYATLGGNVASAPSSRVTHFYTTAVNQGFVTAAMPDNINNEGMVSFWFRLRSLSSEEYSEVYVCDPPNAGDNYIATRWNGSGGETSITDSAEDAVVLPLNTWHHCFISAAEEGSALINGVEYAPDVFDHMDGVISKFGGENAIMDFANIALWDYHYDSFEPPKGPARTGAIDALRSGGPRFDVAEQIGNWPGLAPYAYFVGNSVAGSVANSGTGGTFALTATTGSVKATRF